jgi:hypothetical protein
VSQDPVSQDPVSQLPSGGRRLPGISRGSLAGALKWP